MVPTQEQKLHWLSIKLDKRMLSLHVSGDPNWLVQCLPPTAAIWMEQMVGQGHGICPFWCSESGRNNIRYIKGQFRSRWTLDYSYSHVKHSIGGKQNAYLRSTDCVRLKATFRRTPKNQVYIHFLQIRVKDLAFLVLLQENKRFESYVRGEWW